MLDGWKDDQPNAAQPILKHMRTLQDIGITSITQILTQNAGEHTIVCHEDHLRLLAPLAGTKVKHKRALRAITEYLFHPLGNSPGTPLYRLMLTPPPSLPRRVVSSSHHEWLTAQKAAEASWYKPEALTLPKGWTPPPVGQAPPTTTAPPIALCGKPSSQGPSQKNLHCCCCVTRKGHLKWQRRFPQNCHVVLRVPKQSFKFLRPDHSVAVHDPEEPGHIRWDVTILAVFNNAGQDACPNIPSNHPERYWHAFRIAAFLNCPPEALSSGVLRLLSYAQRTIVCIPCSWTPTRWRTPMAAG